MGVNPAISLRPPCATFAWVLPPLKCLHSNTHQHIHAKHIYMKINKLFYICSQVVKIVLSSHMHLLQFQGWHPMLTMKTSVMSSQQWHNEAIHRTPLCLHFRVFPLLSTFVFEAHVKKTMHI